jgi:WD40 repeat protein
MDPAAPYLGIDFGTTKSCMAWFNPNTGQAELIRNAEGEEKTSSVVYFGPNGVLVGAPAEAMLEEQGERRRVFVSVKRNLVTGETRVIDGVRIKPVQVAAEILKKLKRDAEQGHFHAPVTQAVITHPAAFGQLEQGRILESAALAGLSNVTLIPEPVAAALAYERAGLNVGDRVLVYDLGGGTFDVAVLARGDDGVFRLAMRPEGLKDLGGDDFDRAIYDHCDDVARQTLGRGFVLDGLIDLAILRACRVVKERLTDHDQATLMTYLHSDDGGVVPFRHALDRATLERLISADFVEPTITLTKQVLESAADQGAPIETVVLIGGAAKVPLIQRRLRETLPVEARRWHMQDVAVALGSTLRTAHAPGSRESFAAQPRLATVDTPPPPRTTPAYDRAGASTESTAGDRSSPPHRDPRGGLSDNAQTWPTHNGPVRAIACDSRWIASAGEDRVIKLRKADRPSAVDATLTGHSDVRLIWFNRDGLLRVAADGSDELPYWDQYSGTYSGLALQPGPFRLSERLMFDNTNGNWLDELNEMLFVWSSVGRSVRYCHIGQRLWERREPGEMRRFVPLSLELEYEDRTACVCLPAATLSHLVVGSIKGLVMSHRVRLLRGAVSLEGTAVFQPRAPHVTHEGGVTAIAAHLDMVATSGHDRQLVLWNLAVGKPDLVWSTDTPALRRILFSPDGRLLVGLDDGREVFVWEAKTARALEGYTAPSPARVTALSIRPGGRSLALGLSDGRIAVWNLEDAA